MFKTSQYFPQRLFIYYFALDFGKQNIKSEIKYKLKMVAVKRIFWFHFVYL